MSDSPKSEDRYLQILDTAPDAMVVVGTDGKIVFVNVQTEKIFGHPREALLGQGLDVILPERFRRIHGQQVTRYFANPTVRTMGSGLELYGRHADGRDIPIEVSLSPTHIDGALFVSAAIRDITERKRLENLTKLAGDRLASAVDSIQDPFALFDADGLVILCNSAYRALVGEVVRGALVGKSYAEVLGRWATDLELEGGLGVEAFLTARQADWASDASTFEVKTRDGRALRVSNRRTPEGGMVTTIWDVTEDVRTAAELRDARVLAEAGSAAKTEFLSSMSHELRTPLNAVLGFAQLLQRDRKEPLSERHRVRVDQILKGGEHLLRLIDEILDLSKIEAGGTSISAERIDPLEVMREVLQTLEPAAARARVKLALFLGGDVPSILADRTRFAQILMNLGSNAIKYNRPEGQATFSVELSPDTGFVRATVADTGIGIPADKHQKLFQPFQRAGQETGPIEGTGIGLAITRRLAELMHGRAGFSSEPGVGSKFWVDLPIANASMLPVDLHSEVPHALGHEPHGRVLYVEDNPANVRFLKDVLDRFEGIELYTAPTAELGIELARKVQPALVIMDINLPGMSGIEALAALRRDPETEAIPVIALTAAASERDRQRGAQAGFHRYLTKPVKLDELEAALDEILA
jgi:PAS domain S-box-containing protein